MKKFRYPLERLKQVRELELNTIADELRQVSTAVQETKDNISEKESSIQTAQKRVVDTESQTGTIQPDLRKMAALYVQSVQQEREKLEEILCELEEKQKAVHERLMGKKQSVKMMEKHEDRLQSDYQLHMQRLQQKEDDELWLTRQKA